VIAHKRSLNPSIELSPLSGFGIVTLASLYPIIAVEILAIIAFIMYPGDQILEKIGAADGAEPAPESTPLYDTSPLRELVFGVRAITPLVLLLLFILKVGSPPRSPFQQETLFDFFYLLSFIFYLFFFLLLFSFF